MNSLRWEMRPLGVSVHTINPGTFRTPMLVDGVQNVTRQWQNLEASTRSEYGHHFYVRLSSFLRKFSGFASTRRERVGAAVADAVGGRLPLHRYVVGVDANWLWLPLHRWCPEVVINMMMSFFVGTVLGLGSSRKSVHDQKPQNRT